MRKIATIVILATLAGDVAADSLTSVRVLRANAIIGPADLGVMSTTIPGALTSDTDIVGMETRITLYPGRPILPQHIGPPALVERNQPVIVLFRNGGLTISADGRALSRGAEGDVVRVMNLASRTTVSGTVQEDGSVIVLSRGVSR